MIDENLFTSFRTFFTKRGFSTKRFFFYGRFAIVRAPTQHSRKKIIKWKSALYLNADLIIWYSRNEEGYHRTQKRNETSTLQTVCQKHFYINFLSLLLWILSSSSFLLYRDFVWSDKEIKYLIFPLRIFFLFFEFHFLDR